MESPSSRILILNDDSPKGSRDVERGSERDERKERGREEREKGERERGERRGERLRQL